MDRTPRSPTERLRHSLDDLRPPIARLNRKLVWVLISVCGLVMAVFSLSLGSPEHGPAEGLDRPLAANAADPWWEREPDGVVQAPAKPATGGRAPKPVRSQTVQAAMDSPLSIALAGSEVPAGTARPPIEVSRASVAPRAASSAPAVGAETLAVKAGTFIPAALVTAIHSEQPGPVVAQVTDDIRDTVSSNYVLIPKGSRLLCEYQSAAARGQSRLVLGCTRLIFPNGQSQVLPGEPAADLAGSVGVPGKVNRHLLSSYGTATLLAVISAGVQLSQGSFDREGSDPREIMAGALGQQLGQTSNEILRRELNRPPTIEVAAGTRFTVIVTRDLELGRPYDS